MAMLLENETHCLKLGADFTAELMERNDDPLARWLASYIARLMRELEDAEDAGQVARASSACMDAILKLWEHRASLPFGRQDHSRNGPATKSFE
ncbi:hypothetical protein GIV19_17400 [Pseudomonas syringae]|uniref:hypothetical protein n=1 Tax=Pseudomonas syringae TaxID=317 RepID=UPI001F2A7D2D|nr:hypothetical protein [Pseudomonas syringae]MCF5709059.1 hypothetical protein [Pseudomonas syringae]